MTRRKNQIRVENFGRNIVASPAEFYQPDSELGVLELLAQHSETSIRVVGSRHAWSEGIKTGGALLSLERLNSIEIDESRSIARVGAAVGSKIC